MSLLITPLDFKGFTYDRKPWCNQVESFFQIAMTQTFQPPTRCLATLANFSQVVDLFASFVIGGFTFVPQHNVANRFLTHNNIFAIVRC
jgi:hypothetical protein